MVEMLNPQPDDYVAKLLLESTREELERIERDLVQTRKAPDDYQHAMGQADALRRNLKAMHTICKRVYDK